MIRAKVIREAIASLGAERIESAALRFTMTAVHAWGPEFTCHLSLKRAPKRGENESDADRATVDCSLGIVRNGYTDAGRRYHRRGEGSDAWSRWEYAADTHGSEAIYLPEFAAHRLDRDEIMSLYACARMCDTMHFQLWLDGGTSPMLVERSMHGDILSVHCGHDSGKRLPSWEHRIAERAGPHDWVRIGGAINAWPDTRRTMDVIQRIARVA